MPSLSGSPAEAKLGPPSPKSNEVVVAPKNSRTIEVIATEKGFYKQMRKSEGDVFTVEKVEQLGSWMKCTDSVMEKKRQDLMKERKMILRKAASKPEAGE